MGTAIEIGDCQAGVRLHAFHWPELYCMHRGRAWLGCPICCRLHEDEVTWTRGVRESG